MDGKGDKQVFLMPLGDIPYRTADRFDAGAPALATMSRHYDEASTFEFVLSNAAPVQDRRICAAEHLQRVNHGIAGYRTSLGIEAGTE
jgi:hypothetical protein